MFLAREVRQRLVKELESQPARRGERELVRWTHAELAAEAIERGIVTSISADSVGRFLREVDIKPHHVRGWLNTPRDEQFDEKCHDVCETYRLAPERAKQGIETRRSPTSMWSPVASPTTSAPRAPKWILPPGWPRCWPSVVHTRPGI